MNRTVQGVQGSVQGFYTTPAQLDPLFHWVCSLVCRVCGANACAYTRANSIIVSLLKHALTRTRIYTPAHPAHPAHAIFNAGLAVQGCKHTPAHPAHARFAYTLFI